MEIVIHLFQHTMNLRFLNTRRLAHLQYHSTEQLRRITTPVPNMNSTVGKYPHLVVQYQVQADHIHYLQIANLRKIRTEK